jgi:hypothetical protein
MSSHYNAPPQHAAYVAPDNNLQMQANMSSQQAISYVPAQTNSFVSPSMWQQVVANSLVDGRKRMYTDYTGDAMDAMVKRQR